MSPGHSVRIVTRSYQKIAWRTGVVKALERQFAAFVPQGGVLVELDEEITMCPACIANAAIMVAGVGSGGGILAVFIGKFRKMFKANRLSLIHQAKEK